MRAVLDDGDVLTSVVLACHFDLCIFRYVSRFVACYVTRNVKYPSGETSRMMSQRSFVLRYDMYKAQGTGTTGSWRPNATLFRSGLLPKEIQLHSKIRINEVEE